MLNKLLLLSAAILVQDRGVPPPLPPLPAPGTQGPVGISINGVSIAVPFAPDQFGQPQQPQQQLPPGTATVEGVVTILGTSDPIPGAVVEMRKIDCGRTGGESMTTTSGQDGKFSFKQVRSGNWCIGAAKAGGAFSPAEYRQRGYKSRGIAIPVADNQQVQDI